MIYFLIVFSPYLVGLLPIFIARSRQARIVAILFGAASIGLAVLSVWVGNHASDSLNDIKMAAPIIICSLCLSVVSLFVTYYVDKKYIQKP